MDLLQRLFVQDPRISSFFIYLTSLLSKDWQTYLLDVVRLEWSYAAARRLVDISLSFNALVVNDG